MKFSHAESLESLPPCAHFMFQKKMSASKQFFFSRALDCDRMGRHTFFPVKEVALLLLLLMLSTEEKIPDSYTIFFSKKSQSSPILQVTRSEWESC